MVLTKEQRAAICRANGAKSRGPKTPEGKAISSKNALKFGHTAKAARNIILKKFESEKDYKRFADLIFRNYRPTTPMEAVFVERITSILWRLARVGREEALLISEECESAWRDEKPHHLIQNIETRDALQRYEEKLTKQLQLAIRELEKLQQPSPTPAPSNSVDILPNISVVLREPDPSDK